MCLIKNKKKQYIFFIFYVFCHYDYKINSRNRNIINRIKYGIKIASIKSLIFLSFSILVSLDLSFSYRERIASIDSKVKD